ncbi:MAG: Fructose-bisphosphate aldolase [Candidatus Kaiserbacteria bacterium GW2011_GWB1_52_6]|uniref:Probable fructose-bisphosphate aldolase class 1 n=3 Tax=Candidatus Kaiseribacteriota TaxID=1752734 RepID=A0A0G1XH67_9BACT|nr:MAG: Fructose-bisphosphate aldolase [Candidatus Kaiserbacteria bacterium GW2011_GWA2_52_12]KKW28044.1 MAG: Fructose-bisphosphate aldolase [Candidatus Kaiserbacteria bacterium GW2011_GWB1_52_6]KKW30301.1 MAG: Fructose-bisphosphate aldolase [Candidatus Kaiserbacteria bacterium GW2011_GWC2_52_8b]
MNINDLNAVAEAMVAPGKGILAADESTSSIGKRFAIIGLENTEDNRRAYRQMLITSPGMGEYISGVIMYDETIHQNTTDGASFVKVLQNVGILPGIKVDQGTIEMSGSPKEKVTAGLEGLPERLAGYAALGAKFAKWRAVITIGSTELTTGSELSIPTDANLRQNARDLARYAKNCQDAGIVPMVEPEVLMDGNNTMERCREVTEKVLTAVFEELRAIDVVINGIILKPNMVIPGKESGEKKSPDEVADATLKVFNKTLPNELAGIAFLSGGQGDIEATENLNAINRRGTHPWRVSFSYGRALQSAAMQAWHGNAANIASAQKIFLHRAKMNALASLGKYTAEAEHSS